MNLKQIASWLMSNLQPLLWFAALILAAYIAVDYKQHADLRGVLLLLVLIAAVTSFVVTFTGPVTEARLEAMFRFCYAVGLLIVLVGVLFFFFPRQEENDRTWPQFTGPVGIVLGCTHEPTFENSEKWIADEIACSNSSTQWLLNIGGKVTRCPEGATPEKCEGTQLTGGLVVPVYFLIVSLFGALISLTRRVPEYHRRVGPNCISPLSREEAREYMIFQLMQVLSAPLIATAAYYLIDPGSRATSVAVAFISGFSSETILLWIRNIVTKLEPEKTEKSQVIVTPGQLDFGEQPKGTTSPSKTLLLANRGETPVTVSAMNASPDFAWAHTTPAAGGTPTDLPFTVPATGTHEISMTFKPIETGSREGDLSITDNGTGGPRIVRLTGTGTDDGLASQAERQRPGDVDTEQATSVQLSREQIDFGRLPDGTTERSEPLRLINTGDAVVHVDIAVEGSFDCSPKGRLAIEREQLLTITFKPAAPGSHAGQLTLSSEGQVRKVALNGSA